jgi:uncharacterized protein (TIGR02757 family)
MKNLLEKESKKRDSLKELSYDKPDPLMVALRYKDEYISLICALFAYGNAKQIVKFLDSLDFSLLDRSDEVIKKGLKGKYYRFQTEIDVAEFFIMIKRLKDMGRIENIFYKGYKKENSVIDGLNSLINTILNISNHDSHGYNFLVGTPPTIKSKSTYKRYNMYLRWMVRSDNLDMGLWKRVDKKDLLIPLDTHTFKVSQKLGLLKRKSYDLKAVLELTENLKKFYKSDPVKYDFAIYRIGQERLNIV